MSGPMRSTPPSAIGFSAPQPSSEIEGASLWMMVLRIMRRRIWLIFGIILLVCLIALPMVLSMKKVYMAQSRVLFDSSPALRLAAEETQADLVPLLDTQVERLLSDQVIRQVIADLGIAKLPEFTGKDRGDTLAGQISGLFSPVVSRFAAPSEPEAGPVTPVTSPEDKVAQNFRNALSLSRQGASSAMAIGFASRDPALAVAVPTAVVNTYLAQSNARWQEEISRVSLWMGANIEKDQARIAESRAARDRFLAQSGLGAGGDNQIVQRLNMVEQRQAELDRERFETSLDRRSLAAAQADPDLPARDEPATLERMRQELAQERRELTKASATYGSASQQVQQRAERIASVREMIAAELASWAHILDQRAEARESEANDLKNEINSLRNQLAAARAAEPMAKTLRETVLVQEEALSRQEARYQKLLSQAGIAPVELDVLMPATLLPAPLGPGRKIYMLAAAAAGLLLALIVAVLAELRDKSLRSHEQLAHLAWVTPVGMIPRPKPAERKAMPGLIAKRANTPAAEALRDAALLLECGQRNGFPHLLTVTVPEEGDLLEPIAEWLAVELATQGRKVRLIDARGGQPSAASATARPAPRPMVAQTPPTLISEAAPERLDLADLAQRQGCDPAVMLRRLGEEALQDDIITIIDAPALMSSGGLRLAHEGGQILLVLRWGKTRRAVVELMAALLGRIGVKQVQTLIVGIDPRRHRLYGFDDRLTLASSAPAKVSA